MKNIEIEGKLRTEFGKKGANALRANDNVLCELYGGKENVHFYAHQNDFLGLVYTPDVHLVKLNIEGKKYDAVMKEIQFHPVTDKILHIDFVQVFAEKQVVMDIPVKIEGVSAGVKAGGKLKVKRRTLKVKGFTKDFPEHLTIDISNLNIGDSIRIGDLVYNNLEIIDNKRAMIASVATTRNAQKEGEEAAAAPAAAPAAPAAE
ncbi:MAG TPA: 50S ribosomal protein L25/general stress protein Ctc [Bacteroidales bacterium]|nr:50S ribosomal protein L25/general stress protein Ctc [Bacteroidales bacterium]